MSYPCPCLFGFIGEFLSFLPLSFNFTLPMPTSLSAMCMPRISLSCFGLLRITLLPFAIDSLGYAQTIKRLERPKQYIFRFSSQILRTIRRNLDSSTRPQSSISPVSSETVRIPVQIKLAHLPLVQQTQKWIGTSSPPPTPVQQSWKCSDLPFSASKRV
jgi:hypothetical protein